jgi:riboflavin kinase/FMN adenylyltransferase
MKVYRDIAHLPSFREAVVTIGTFDGVHQGHRRIIAQLVDEARKVGGETVIITFHPHPRKIVRPDSTIHLITTLEEKSRLLEQLGIDNLVVVPFVEAFANLSATGYVEDFLLRYFHPHSLIIGYDHRFGQGRKGDFHLLEEYAEKRGFHLIEIPPHLLHESAISSTRIRESLTRGQIEAANELLGYPYFFEGRVVTGNKLGRTIGYPTANIRIQDPDKIVPAKGVYAVRLEVLNEAHAGQVYAGMMNIGIRPTIDGTLEVIEVNIFSFTDDIYEQTVRVTVFHYLRAEQKFNGLDALKSQLAQDRQQAMNLLQQ